ncbi:MAG TPA: polysaccharide biosynthesis C-terminal domain-containing protein [Gaiellaceae bacterium]|nr:polysaccharide biosynthesis C-terminal domain-containing protein [Gaiellaceae bacterium]
MTNDTAGSVLSGPEAGARVIRGGAARVAAYGASVALAAATSVVLLRYLGVERFGVFATVGAIIGVVAGATDAGLGIVGNRELARAGGADRLRVLNALVALRLLLTPAGTLAAVAFAIVAGYDRVVVLGILLAGAGVVVLNVHVTLAQLLAVDLRLVVLSGLDLARAALTFAGVAVLAAAGAGLLSFFGVGIGVALVLLAITPFIIPAARNCRPQAGRVMWTLLRTAAPLGLALAMNVVYFRVLVVVTSLVGTATAVGHFGTSFRIIELLAALPYVLLSAALPMLAVDAQEDVGRFVRVGVRLTETALTVGLGLALLTASLAEPVVLLVGGEPYRGAAPVLQIQALALVPLFLATAWTLILVALGSMRALAFANAGALVLVVGVGIPLVAADGARGAAVAAVTAEAVLAAAIGVVLTRVAPGQLRIPERAPRVLAAAAAGAATAVVVPHALLSGVAAGAVYSTALVLLRAVPPELTEQVRALKRMKG